MPGKLTGHNQFKLLRELATSNYTQLQLAEKYDVTQQGISDFAKKHADEIQEIRDNLEDQFAGLWVARKEARVAAYLRDVAEIDAMDEVDGEHRRIRQAALKAVAEEMGQLKQTVEVKTVNYVVDGMDPSALK